VYRGNRRTDSAGSGEESHVCVGKLRQSEQKHHPLAHWKRCFDSLPGIFSFFFFFFFNFIIVGNSDSYEIAPNAEFCDFRHCRSAGVVCKYDHVQPHTEQSNVLFDDVWIAGKDLFFCVCLVV
jgi:hypothetical protein